MCCVCGRTPKPAPCRPPLLPEWTEPPPFDEGLREPMVGFEPTACCLRNSCSTAELHRRVGVHILGQWLGIGQSSWGCSLADRTGGWGRLRRDHERGPGPEGGRVGDVVGPHQRVGRHVELAGYLI